jgi:cobalt-zinc-cadmium resistance protein CzcA
VAEAQRRIDETLSAGMPAGYFVRYGGQFEHLQRASKRLTLVVPLALALIFILLYMTYHRVTDAVRIFLTLPIGAVGGVLALWLRDMVFVSHLRTVLATGVPLREAIEQTALTRLRPVLMTGLVASLGFAPMALSTGVGAEVQRPLATVVIGGVVTSTMLTLLVLPVIYSVVGKRGHVRT